MTAELQNKEEEKTAEDDDIAAFTEIVVQNLSAVLGMNEVTLVLISIGIIPSVGQAISHQRPLFSHGRQAKQVNKTLIIACLPTDTKIAR